MYWKLSLPVPVSSLSWFLGKIKGKSFRENKISYGNSKTNIVESHYFWELLSIPKTSEPFEKLLELLSDVIFDAELKPISSDDLVSFYEVIVLEILWMVDLMASDDLFCRIVMYALIFSE